MENNIFSGFTTNDEGGNQQHLYQRIAQFLHGLIDIGTLSPGTMIPSSRELAKLLGVSRKTAVNAINTLIYNGELVAKDRSGVFVAQPDDATRNAAKAEAGKAEYSIIINDGFPDTSFIPFREYTRAHRQIFNRMAQWQKLGYNDPMGYQKFRDSLSKMLKSQRGLDASSDEICVVRGAQMGLYLAAHVLLQNGGHVALEMPCYDNAKRAFESAGLNLHFIPVDKEGIDTDQLAALCKEVNLSAIYVTPRHQYPTTVTLSMPRREKIVELAQTYGFIVIEDDFGSEYRFTTQRIPPLAAMLPKSQYLYVGTFSKIFAPSTRVGYVVSSREIVRRIADYRTLIDMQGDIAAERAFHELNVNGDINRHIRQSTKIYAKRLQFASAEIERLLGNAVSYEPPIGGLALWIGFPDRRINAAMLAKHFEERHVKIPVYTLADGTAGIRIGYASLKPQQLTDTLMIIKDLVQH